MWAEQGHGSKPAANGSLCPRDWVQRVRTGDRFLFAIFLERQSLRCVFEIISGRIPYSKNQHAHRPLGERLLPSNKQILEESQLMRSSDVDSERSATEYCRCLSIDCFQCVMSLVVTSCIAC